MSTWESDEARLARWCEEGTTVDCRGKEYVVLGRTGHHPDHGDGDWWRLATVEEYAPGLPRKYDLMRSYVIKHTWEEKAEERRRGQEERAKKKAEADAKRQRAEGALARLMLLQGGAVTLRENAPNLSGGIVGYSVSGWGRDKVTLSMTTETLSLFVDGIFAHLLKLSGASLLEGEEP